MKYIPQVYIMQPIKIYSSCFKWHENWSMLFKHVLFNISLYFLCLKEMMIAVPCFKNSSGLCGLQTFKKHWQSAWPMRSSSMTDWQHPTWSANVAVTAQLEDGTIKHGWAASNIVLQLSSIWLLPHSAILYDNSWPMRALLSDGKGKCTLHELRSTLTESWNWTLALRTKLMQLYNTKLKMWMFCFTMKPPRAICKDTYFLPHKPSNSYIFIALQRSIIYINAKISTAAFLKPCCKNPDLLSNQNDAYLFILMEGRTESQALHETAFEKC